MIKYALRCANGHEFASWFKNSEAYERLRKRRQVTCDECGSDKVEKALMAPRVSRAQTTAANESAVHADTGARRAALRALRENILAHTEDVGDRFAAEARRIANEDAPERPIRGEASIHEVHSLLEDGIPAFPIPPAPDDKN